MTSNAILFRAAYAIPGMLTRGTHDNKIEAQAYNTALVSYPSTGAAGQFLAFGWPGKMSSSLFVPLAVVGDTTPYGWLVRPYPISGANASDPLGTAVPNCAAGVAANVLRSGYIGVFVQAGASSVAQGGTVYVRYANGAAGTPVGGIEGAYISGTNVALTTWSGGAMGSMFMGPADANGYAEVAFNV
jgi:hypothetical protein